MNFADFLIMRHELLLTIAVIILLLAEIFISREQKSKVIWLAIGLFAVITLAGFFPVINGELFGGMYIADNLRVLMKNLLNIGVFIVLLQSVEWIRSSENSGKRAEFYLLLFCTLIGMNFMISAGDFLMFYLSLELATIPMAVLAAYEKNNSKSAEAGVKLILSAAFSSALMLYGISILYGLTGSVYFTDVAAVLHADNLTIFAFIFFFTGLAFKISLVPFHFWTPDVYEGAPVNVTAYLSVISKGAAVFISVIVLFNIFGPLAFAWQKMLYVLAIVTMTGGNIFALRQKNMKRFLAYSSIAQAGFILLGIIGGTAMGMTSVIYFILIYIFSNLAAFGVVSVIKNKSGKENMDDFNGLYATNPLLSLTLTLALFSLAGIPPVAGFFGKFFLFTAVAEAGFYWLLLIAALNATLALYYYLLPIKAMFINKNLNPIANFKIDIAARIAMLICVFGVLITGFASQVYEFIYTLSFGI